MVPRGCAADWPVCRIARPVNFQDDLCLTALTLTLTAVGTCAGLRQVGLGRLTGLAGSPCM